MKLCGSTAFGEGAGVGPVFTGESSMDEGACSSDISASSKDSLESKDPQSLSPWRDTGLSSRLLSRGMINSQLVRAGEGYRCPYPCLGGTGDQGWMLTPWSLGHRRRLMSLLFAFGPREEQPVLAIHLGSVPH